TWHLIHWQQTPKAIRQTQTLRGNYSDTRLHDRLMKVLRQGDGHRIASAVEQAKIDASVQDVDMQIDLDSAEAGLTTTLTPLDMQQQLAPLLETVMACAHACVQRAGLRSGDLDAIYLTGGSSALRPFQQALRRSFAGVPLVEGDLFGGVAAGLAYAARNAA
ncbi:MAG: Hsp70 family protein, partial [Variovorax sp.]